VSTIETSAPESKSSAAFSLLILPTALACLNHFPGAWYFQYPRDSPGISSNSISTSDRAYSSIFRTLAIIEVGFSSHVLSVELVSLLTSLIGCFSMQSPERSARTRFQPGERSSLTSSPRW
jgi:hypothetical protein